ncbi:Y55_G0008460.mRNA.1.CDS.1 [Saccharomyces cerevisiae]|nr:Y55_G0008460.mRNA.1.CDS.1 [Saccharomyces cerevisiae]
MMIIIFIELCKIADSLLWIPKSSRRTSSTFYIPSIIALLKMESQQLSQNSPSLQIVGILLLVKAIISGIQNILEVLLEDIGIHKRVSLVQHNNVFFLFLL